MIEEQKKQEAANGNSIPEQNVGRLGDGTSAKKQTEKEAPSKPLTAEEKLKLAKAVTTQLNNEYKEGGILVQKMGKRSTKSLALVCRHGTAHSGRNRYWLRRHSRRAYYRDLWA